LYQTTISSSQRVLFLHKRQPRRPLKPQQHASLNRMSDDIRQSFARMTSAKDARECVREWQERKACRAEDPLFGGSDVGSDAVLAGNVAAAATLSGKVIASSENALVTNAGARVWFPAQHVNKCFLAPSTKRWR
jgi:hypothetical protein